MATAAAAAAQSSTDDFVDAFRRTRYSADRDGDVVRFGPDRAADRRPISMSVAPRPSTDGPAFPTRAPLPQAAAQVTEDDQEQLGRAGVLRDRFGRPTSDPNPHMWPIGARGLMEAHGVYDEMLVGDGAIAGTWVLATREVMRGSYEVKTPPNPTREEGRAAELTAAYFGLDGTCGMLTGGLRRLLLHLMFSVSHGTSVMERSLGSARWRRRTVTVPNRVSWRPIRTIERWLYQGDRLVGATQIVKDEQGAGSTRRRVNIPVNRLLIAAHHGTDAAAEGTSAYRPCFAYWKAKKGSIIRHEMAQESLFGGIAILKELADDRGRPMATLSQTDRDLLLEAFRALARGRLQHLEIPVGYDFAQAHPQFQIPDPTNYLRYLDHQILMTSLAGLLGLDASHSGSKSLASDMGAILYASISAIAQGLLDVINGLPGLEWTGLIRQIVDTNIPVHDGFRYPRLRLLNIQHRDPKSLIDSMRLGVQMKLITWGAEEEAQVRRQLELPELTIEELEQRRALLFGLGLADGEQQSQEGTQAPSEPPIEGTSGSGGDDDSQGEDPTDEEATDGA